jgi:hypothetical protein
MGAAADKLGGVMIALLKRYRYKGQYGYIYIMAINDEDALIQAKRSLYRTEQPDLGKLEIYNTQTLQYERVSS